MLKFCKALAFYRFIMLFNLFCLLGIIYTRPVNITVIGIGLNTSQYVKATARFDGSASTFVSLISLIERNYYNPSA